MLTKQECYKALHIPDTVTEDNFKEFAENNIKCSFGLFKPNTILLYVGKAEKSVVLGPNGEEWKDLKKIHDRVYGVVIDFILNQETVAKIPKLGDVLYVDRYAGELLPYQKSETEMLYYKAVKSDEINVLIQ